MSLNVLNIYKLRVLLKLYYRSENPAFFLRKPPTKKQHFFVWYKNLSNIQDGISCHSYIELFLKMKINELLSTEYCACLPCKNTFKGAYWNWENCLASDM